MLCTEGGKRLIVGYAGTNLIRKKTICMYMIHVDKYWVPKDTMDFGYHFLICQKDFLAYPGIPGTSPVWKKYKRWQP